MIVQFEEIEGSMDYQKNMDEGVKGTKKGLFNKVCFHQCNVEFIAVYDQNQVLVTGTEIKFNCSLKCGLGNIYGISAFQ